MAFLNPLNFMQKQLPQPVICFIGTKQGISFYTRYLRTIRYSILFGLALIILLRESYLFNRQKLVLEKAQAGRLEQGPSIERMEGVFY